MRNGNLEIGADNILRPIHIPSLPRINNVVVVIRKRLGEKNMWEFLTIQPLYYGFITTESLALQGGEEVS
jgi:hypothetical protein